MPEAKPGGLGELTPSLCGDAVLFSLGSPPSVGLGEWGVFSHWGGTPFLVCERRVPYLC